MIFFVFKEYIDLYCGIYLFFMQRNFVDICYFFRFYIFSSWFDLIIIFFIGFGRRLRRDFFYFVVFFKVKIILCVDEFIGSCLFCLGQSRGLSYCLFVVILGWRLSFSFFFNLMSGLGKLVLFGNCQVFELEICSLW